ncbi:MULTISPECIES: polysaccharide deacetylase family protein [Devosia]|uniref:polysaccharide deacetylase family protein n=1 Tax=Devosia TaxID=46913 RepID=UPI000CE9A1D9|nr:MULTISPECIES: polysaccharide deacetylase family protein [Devosia]AVF02929.1 xylanase [Devosia sp. I507]
MYGRANVPHGLMFHHFTDAKHPAGQGAITADQFSDMLRYAGLQRILSPETWKQKARSGRLAPGDLCITFDDALLCQYEIAKPVLDDLGLQAFWFVYSGVFEGRADRLEIYRHYRTTRFQDVDAFYEAFFRSLSCSVHRDQYHAARSEFANLSYLKEFGFYSDTDRLFRYLRDRILGPSGYFEAMDQMIEGDPSYSRSKAGEALWMKQHHLKQLYESGHEIGLHSYTHPTSIADLPTDEQRAEYEKNLTHLQKALGVTPDTMSHPCGSYNEETLVVLRNMDVKMGFVSSMKLVDDPLCLPRQDHSNIAIEMGMR